MIDNKTGHTAVLTDRKRLEISGVKDVKSFDEKQVTLITQLGEMSIGGEALQVGKLDIEIGEIILTGTIYSVQYIEPDNNAGRGFFSRLFS